MLLLHFQIKVEPYWNVNALKLSLRDITALIKVEPYWNVNYVPYLTTKYIQRIKVEPYWNVNAEEKMRNCCYAFD